VSLCFRAPQSVIIDVLRGLNAIFGEYQNLKHTPWKYIMVRLESIYHSTINQGLCEIAFHQQNKIRLTSLAREVLFEGDKVQLTTVQKLTRRKQN
jgi:ATP-dependent DNA helicase RecQ